MTPTATARANGRGTDHCGRQRVVVTGIGAVTPLGLSVPEFWEAMLQGQSGAATITSFDASAFTTHFACELKGFDPLKTLDRKQAQRLDRFAQYAVAAAEEALQDAGITPDTLSMLARERAGVVFGSGIGGLQTFQEQTQAYLKGGPRRLSPFFIPMMIPDIASGVIAIRYGFRGPNHCVVSACATGNHNIADATSLIRYGDADLMLCGGAEAAICELGVGGFAAMHALSTRNDDPATASRPFDKGRDGFVMGDGAGALVLESLDHARRRDARIYAEVIGVGSSADAHHVTAPHPEGLGARLAMERVLAEGEPGARRCRRHQHARHVHPAGRRGRESSRAHRVRSARARADRHVDQEHDGSHAGCCWRGGGDRVGALDRPQRRPADDQRHRPRSRLRPLLCAQQARPPPSARGVEQRIRLWRPQYVRRVQGV